MFWEKSSWLKSLIHFTGLLVMHYFPAGVTRRLMACSLVLRSAVQHTLRSRTAAKSILGFYSTENEINFKSSNNINDKLTG